MNPHPDRPTASAYVAVLARLTFATIAYGTNIYLPETYHAAKARIWADIGQYGRAVRHLRKYFQNNLTTDERLWGHQILGWCHAELGQFTSAVEQYRLAYAIEKRLRLILALADAELELGNATAARGLLMEASAKQEELDDDTRSIFENLEDRLRAPVVAAVIESQPAAAAVLRDERRQRLYLVCAIPFVLLAWAAWATGGATVAVVLLGLALVCAVQFVYPTRGIWFVVLLIYGLLTALVLLPFLLDLDRLRRGEYTYIIGSADTSLFWGAVLTASLTLTWLLVRRRPRRTSVRPPGEGTSLS